MRVADALLENGVARAALPAIDPETGARGIIRGRGSVTPEAPPPGVDLVELHTGEDYLPAVRTMLEQRERRRAH